MNRFCILFLLGINVTFSQEIDFKKTPMLFYTPNFFSSAPNTLENDSKQIDTSNIDYINYNGVLVSKNQLDSISEGKYSLNLSEYKSMNDLKKGDLVLVDGIFESYVGAVIELGLDKLSAKLAFIVPDKSIKISWFKIKYLKKIIIN